MQTPYILTQVHTYSHAHTCGHTQPTSPDHQLSHPVLVGGREQLCPPRPPHPSHIGSKEVQETRPAPCHPHPHFSPPQAALCGLPCLAAVSAMGCLAPGASGASPVAGATSPPLPTLRLGSQGPESAPWFRSDLGGPLGGCGPRATAGVPRSSLQQRRRCPGGCAGPAIPPGWQSSRPHQSAWSSLCLHGARRCQLSARG